MFWAQRLKQDEQDATWAISYADMMTLLLAVFVMIAAMSEMGTGRKFASVSRAVRGALGFQVEGSDAAQQIARPPTLAEQLIRAGLILPVGSMPRVQEEALRCCDVSNQGNRLMIRIAGKASFDRFSAALKPEAQTAVERIAAMLKEGKALIEIRGYNGDGVENDTVSHAAIDRSYARAAAIVDALAKGGVEPERMIVSACGDQSPLVAQTVESPVAAANRRIEILVHAVSSMDGKDQFAEKGQYENAR